MTFILSSRNGQNTCPENDIVLYFSHCCASNCLVYFYSLMQEILERQRDYMDSKSHYLSTCIPTSHLELLIQSPEKKQQQHIFEELFQRTLKFWLYFFQLLIYFSATVFNKTLQKNCSYFLSLNLPAILLWNNSNQACIHNHPILPLSSQRITFIESSFWLVVVILIQICCGFKYSLNSTATCMSQRGKADPHFTIFPK